MTVHNEILDLELRRDPWDFIHQNQESENFQHPEVVLNGLGFIIKVKSVCHIGTGFLQQFNKPSLLFADPSSHLILHLVGCDVDVNVDVQSSHSPKDSLVRDPGVATSTVAPIQPCHGSNL